MLSKEELDLLLSKNEITKEEYDSLIIESVPSVWIESHLCDFTKQPDESGMYPPFILRWYQRKIINDPSRQKVLRLGRQAGKSILIVPDMIHKTITNNATTAIVVTPYNYQVIGLYEKITNFIHVSPILSEMVEVTTKNPMLIRWSNRSQIKLFTAGASSGGTAASIRGQCLTSDTTISMSDGSIKNILDVNNGDKVLTFNDKNMKIESSDVIDVIDNGIKDVYHITLASGREIKATSEHPFFTLYGWINAKDIKVGHRIAIPRQTIFGNTDVSIDEAAFIAYMIGDGNCGTSANDHIGFTGSRKKIAIIKDMQKICSNLGISTSIYTRKQNDNILSLRLLNGVTGNVRNMLKKYGLYGKYSYEKYIPESIYTAKREVLKEFIPRLISTDGWICSSIEIGYCTTSKRLATQLQSLLLKFGIYSRMRSRSKFLNNKECRRQYVVSIRDKYNVSKFLNDIGFIPGKEDKCKEVLSLVEYKNEMQTKFDQFDTRKIILDACKRKGISMYELRKHVNASQRNTHSLNLLKRINSVLNDDIIQTIIDSDILVDKVAKIAIEHNLSTYNLTIKNTHTFIANDMITHNTAKWLYIDEADYIPHTALDAILMVTSSFGDEAKLVFSSTPVGTKTYFYDLCHSDLWKQFHYPSTVSPTWTKEVDTNALEVLGPTGYSHEVLAEFTDSSGGKFKKKDIKIMFNADISIDGKIQHVYKYDMKNIMLPLMRTTLIGVDWNSSSNGTQIYVLGVSKADVNKLYVIDYCNIDVTDFTQSTAISKIVEFNKLYNPLYIYVDDGYGCVSIDTHILTSSGTIKIVDRFQNEDVLTDNGKYEKIITKFMNIEKQSYYLTSKYLEPLTISKDHLVKVYCSDLNLYRWKTISKIDPRFDYLVSNKIKYNANRFLDLYDLLKSNGVNVTSDNNYIKLTSSEYHMERYIDLKSKYFNIVYTFFILYGKVEDEYINIYLDDIDDKRIYDDLEESLFVLFPGALVYSDYEARYISIKSKLAYVILQSLTNENNHILDKLKPYVFKYIIHYIFYKNYNMSTPVLKSIDIPLSMAYEIRQYLINNNLLPSIIVNNKEAYLILNVYESDQYLVSDIFGYVFINFEKDINKDYICNKSRICIPFNTPIKVGKVKDLVDLSVENNHSYIANGIVVHNSMQIEVLHRMGIVDKTTRLDKRVVGINFSSNIEIWDPITQEMKPKYAKGFMVDNITRLSEQHSLYLPFDESNSGSENKKNTLETAMTNFRQERISASGKPVFICEGGNDHKLDALMLACLAYTQHYKKINDKMFGYTLPKTNILKLRNDPSIIDRQIGNIKQQSNVKEFPLPIGNTISKSSQYSKYYEKAKGILTRSRTNRNFHNRRLDNRLIKRNIL